MNILTILEQNKFYNKEKAGKVIVPSALEQDNNDNCIEFLKMS